MLLAGDLILGLAFSLAPRISTETDRDHDLDPSFITSQNA